MPEQQSVRADAMALGARRCARRCRRSGDQPPHRRSPRAARQPDHRRGRAGRPADSGEARRGRDPARRPQGQATAGHRRPGGRAAAVRPLRRPGATLPERRRRGLRDPGGGGAGCRAVAVRRSRHGLPADPRRGDHLAGRTGRAHRATAPPALQRHRPGPALPAARVGCGPGQPGRRGARVERRRPPARRRRRPQVAEADRRDLPSRPGRRRGRAQRHRGLADRGQPLLPDRHLVQPTGDRAGRLDAPHPRDGRPRDHADVRRPAGPASHRDVDDAQLRVQHRRRQPDQQRLVERHLAQGPAGRGGRPVRC